MSGSAAARLRQLLGEAHGHTVRSFDGPEGVYGSFFGHPPLDAMVPRGLASSLHIFSVSRACETGLLAGFACAVLARLARTGGAVVWITERLSSTEGGELHGPGFAAMGGDPAALLMVYAKRSTEVLWAAEQALGTAAVGAVVAEFASEPRALDLTATRRIALRSERAGVPVYLLTAGDMELQATASRTRWHVAPAPSRVTAPRPTLLGAPLWSLALTKNRDGPCGTCLAGFAPHTGTFFAAAPNPAPWAERPWSEPLPAGETSVKLAVVSLSAARRRHDAYVRERR